jgi:hypothetical protein
MQGAICLGARCATCLGARALTKSSSTAIAARLRADLTPSAPSACTQAEPSARGPTKRAGSTSRAWSTTAHSSTRWRSSTIPHGSACATPTAGSALSRQFPRVTIVPTRPRCATGGAPFPGASTLVTPRGWCCVEGRVLAASWRHTSRVRSSSAPAGTSSSRSVRTRSASRSSARPAPTASSTSQARPSGTSAPPSPSCS